MIIKLLQFVAGIFSLAVATVSYAQPPTSQPIRGDWPMWGGSPERNAVSVERGIPHEWDLKTKRNIKWVAPLGTYSYGGPVVAGGKVYVGTNNAGEFRPHSKGDKGCLLCFDEKTGKLLWQATHDKLPGGSVVDWPEQGVASTPHVEGERVYYVSNRCELICADASGFRDDENDGPFKDEKYKDAQDADFVWILDMIGQLGVFPHNLAACAPVGAGDLIFVCTSNGVDESHEKLPAPQAPSFIAVDKKTGQVVWQCNDPSQNIMHGQWSSPAYGLIDGRPQVIFGGGDGWCYAFEPATGKLIWKFNLNPPDAVWKVGGMGTKTSIVSTPVIYDNKVFLAAGDDPEQCRGSGHLYAIDATKTGDITATGQVWHVGSEEFGRTIASVAIADGLLYAADLDGFLSCFDVKTGVRHWQYDMEAAVWGSPCVVDGKVMLGNTDGELVVLRHGKVMKELARNDMRYPIYTTPAVAHGTLYVVTQKFLYAIQTPTDIAPAQAWPTFRGSPQLTGVAGSTLPDQLHVRWTYEAAGPITSTAAIADGIVYVGSEENMLYALDLATGALKWQYQTQGAIESSPTVINKTAIFGDEVGVLYACDALTGVLRWKFETKGRIISSANPHDDRVVFGSYDGVLYCLRVADGHLIWKYQTEERLHGTPAVVGAYVLIAGCDAHLHVLELEGGTPVRKLVLGSVTGCSPAVNGTRVFLGTYGEQVIALDWQTGQVLWRFEDTDNSFPFMSSAAVTDGLVLIGGRDKRLRALDPQTGVQRWEFLSKGHIDGSPVIVGQRVFAGSADGNLYAVKLATGEELWRFECGASLYASPAVADECLVISTDDGLVYCFGE